MVCISFLFCCLWLVSFANVANVSVAGEYREGIAVGRSLAWSGTGSSGTGNYLEIFEFQRWEVWRKDSEYGVRIGFVACFESISGAGLQIKRICFQAA